MRLCCPPGRGCNASGGSEPCVLELCRAAAAEEPEAALAVARWDEWQEAAERLASRADRRFHRRSYERARESALTALLMRAEGDRTGKRLSVRRRGRRPHFERRPAARKRGSS